MSVASKTETIHRKYYMVPGTEIPNSSSSIEKINSFQHKWSCKILFIILTPMKDQTNIFTLNFSCRLFRDYFDKSDIYYLTIAMMFFHAEVHLVFCWCLHNTVILFKALGKIHIITVP